MEDVELVWNEKRCSEAHVKCGSLRSDQGDTLAGDDRVIKALKEGKSYKFLGVLESAKEDELVLREHLRYFFKGYLLSGPTPVGLSQVVAFNQYALPFLAFAMCTQKWPLSELQQLDRETKKLIKESGGSHQSTST